jgi:hypothetical protein
MVHELRVVDLVKVDHRWASLERGPDSHFHAGV